MQCLVHAFVLHFVCWPHWVSEEAEPVSEEAEPRRKRQQAIRADVCMHNGDRVHKGIDTYRHNINNLIDTLYSRAASPWCLLHGKISWHMVLQISFAIWQPMLVSMILNSDAVCVYIYMPSNRLSKWLHHHVCHDSQHVCIICFDVHGACLRPAISFSSPIHNHIQVMLFHSNLAQTFVIRVDD